MPRARITFLHDEKHPDEKHSFTVTDAHGKSTTLDADNGHHVVDVEDGGEIALGKPAKSEKKGKK